MAADIQQIIRETAIASGIDPELAIAVARQESGFNQFAVGDGGDSHGIFQENVHGRGAGRAPDYDPVRQTQRFAADVKRLLATGFTGTYGEIGAAAQRPFDPVGYARSIDAATGGGKPPGGLMATSVRTDEEQSPPSSGILDIQRRTMQAELDLLLRELNSTTTDDPLQRALKQAQIDQIRADIANIGFGTATSAATSAASLAEQRRQFDLSMQADAARQAADNAQNAGLLALQQGNAAEAKRQFDIAQSETIRWHDLQAQDMARTQQLAAAKYGTDVYNKLADLASNPRNFMEQFFRLRGQPAPATAGNYGNSPYGGLSIQPLEQFLPKFLGQVGLGTPAPGAMGARPAAGAMPGMGGPAMGAPGMAPAGAVDPSAAFNAALADPNADLSPFFGTGGTTITRTDPRLGPASGQFPTAVLPATAPTATQGPTAEQLGAQDALIAQGRKPKFWSNGVAAFGKGGELTMTEPHAVINLITGQIAAIAGEEPGPGPSGFVPETATFDGEAILLDDYGAPIPVQSPPPSQLPAVSTAPGVYAPTYNPAPAPNYVAQPGLPPAPQPIPQTAQPVAPVAAPLPQPTTQQQADLARWLAGGAGAPIVTQPVTAPQPIQQPQPVRQFQPVTTTSFTPQTFTAPVAPAPVAPVAPVVPPVITPTPQVSAPIESLRQTPSGLGKNPVFLPEDVAANDPILAAMIQSGTFPPFLQRIFAQQKGLAGLGTNVPQQTDLPPGVPLISKIAFTQMIPSEQQAFMSYLSAHGLAPEDYFALVEAASPQGGTSNAMAFPRFLSQ